MDLLHQALEYVLHLNKHLDAFIGEYGAWVYALVFLIIFCETGLVVTPFLPGDSLLFALGALAAGGNPDPWLMALTIAVAAALGNTTNYTIGRFLGPRVFSFKKSRWFNPKHLDGAHRFYERHGAMALIITRFAPILRTFAPFVAGIAKMTYARFQMYNVAGALMWVLVVFGAGFWFGNIGWVKQNFGSVVIAIIIISLMPAAVEFLREYRRSRNERTTT